MIDRGLFEFEIPPRGKLTAYSYLPLFPAPSFSVSLSLPPRSTFFFFCVARERAGHAVEQLSRVVPRRGGWFLPARYTRRQRTLGSFVHRSSVPKARSVYQLLTFPHPRLAYLVIYKSNAVDRCATRIEGSGPTAVASKRDSGTGCTNRSSTHTRCHIGIVF